MLEFEKHQKSKKPWKKSEAENGLNIKINI